METVSTLITFNSIKLGCSSFKTIYSAILCVATFFYLLLLRYSPLVLWFAANAIIFSVYMLSTSRHPNGHSEIQAELVHPILSSLPSDRWDDYPSPPAESEPIDKEVTCVDTVVVKDKKVTTKEINLDETWKTNMLQSSTAVEKKPLLKKSGTWERSRRRLQRADEAEVKPELKKSATYKDITEESAAHNQQVVEEKASIEDLGWRTRNVLVMTHDDLFIRIENFIKKQHDNLRLQRQEEYRQFLESFCK